MPTTQSKHPWRTIVRTVFELVVGGAAAAPLIYVAVTQKDPAMAGGAVATLLVVAGAITRVLALPYVEQFLRKHVSWLAAEPEA